MRRTHSFASFVSAVTCAAVCVGAMPAGAYRVIVSQDTPAPGGGTMGACDGAAINAFGDVAFSCTSGLYVLRGPELIQVFEDGAAVPDIGVIDLEAIDFPASLRGTHVGFKAPVDGVPKVLHFDLATRILRVAAEPGVSAAYGSANFFLEQPAVSASGALLARDGDGEWVALFNNGFAVIEQIGAPSLIPNATITSFATQLEMNDDESAAVFGTANDGIGSRGFAWLKARDAAPALLEPANLGANDRFNAGEGAIAQDGTIGFFGILTLSAAAPVNSVWVSDDGAPPVPTLELPFLIDGAPASALLRKPVMGNGGRYALLMNANENAIVWWDGAAAQVVAAGGQEVPDRPGLTLSLIDALAVGGSPEIIVFRASCNDLSIFECGGVFKVSTDTGVLSTVAAVDDEIDLGALGVVTVDFAEIFPSLGTGYAQPISDSGEVVFHGSFSVDGVPIGEAIVADGEGGVGALPDLALALDVTKAQALETFRLGVSITSVDPTAPLATGVELVIETGDLFLDIDRASGMTCTRREGLRGGVCAIRDVPADDIVSASVEIVAVDPGTFPVTGTLTLSGDANPANNTAAVEIQAGEPAAQTPPPEPPPASGCPFLSATGPQAAPGSSAVVLFGLLAALGVRRRKPM